MLLTTSDEIKNAVINIARDSGNDYPVLIAVAYWGEDADFILPEGLMYRIACNLFSQGTNPKVVRKLILRGDSEIRSVSNLHAKVVVGQRSALLGSANFSNAAMGIKRESSLIEAAFYLEDPETLKEMRSWFWEKVWQTSHLITEADLRAAEVIWQQRDQKQEASFPSRDTLEEALFLKPEIKGCNRIRMASEMIERIYEEKIQNLNKANVRVPAFVGNLLWVYAGNKVDTKLPKGHFANLSDVWCRIYDPEAKHPGYLKDHIINLLELVAAHKDPRGAIVAQLATRYIDDGFPGMPHDKS